MKIVALPDLHDRGTHYLEKIAGVLSAADLVLLVGDLTNAGRMADGARIVQAVQQHNANILAVSGNWDPLEVQTSLSKCGVSLDRRHVLIEGVAFIGLGGSVHGVGGPNEFTEEELGQFLSTAADGVSPDSPQIMVCHQPPVNTLNDRTWLGSHVGSKTVRAYIEARQPLICFTGHIHEGKGIDTIGSTKIVNPGPIWRGGYAYAEVVDSQVIALEIRPL